MQPGMLLQDRFLCLRRLGKGGMGEVYLAVDKAANGIEVAIKKILQASAANEESFKRFQTEIEANRMIQSPHIVEAKEVLNSEEGLLYVMEYLPGGTLAEKMRAEKISHKNSVKILISICRGLSSIHERGFVHRDLKPENIFFDDLGNPKIGDFGLARVVGSNSLTQDKVVLGTTLYIPPEYIETGESDHRGDLYALGIIAFELLARKSPFPGRTTDEIIKSKFQPISITPLIDQKVDKSLIYITLKLLEFRLSNRYQTALEPLKALESWLDQQS